MFSFPQSCIPVYTAKSSKAITFKYVSVTKKKSKCNAKRFFPIFVLFTKAIENWDPKTLIPGVIFPQLEKVWGVFFLVISDDLNPFKIDLDEKWPQPQSFVFLTVFKPELAIKPTWLIFFMMICTIYDHTSLRVRTRYPFIKLCNSKRRGWDEVWLTLFSGNRILFYSFLHLGQNSYFKLTMKWHSQKVWCLYGQIF